MASHPSRLPIFLLLVAVLFQRQIRLTRRVHSFGKFTGSFDFGLGFTTKRVRYYELPDPNFPRRDSRLPMRTSFRESTVLTGNDASWFDPQRQCLNTCCAEKVAISMGHEDLRVKNTVDGLDLAEVLIHGHSLPAHLQNAFHGAPLNDPHNTSMVHS